MVLELYIHGTMNGGHLETLFLVTGDSPRLVVVFGCLYCGSDGHVEYSLIARSITGFVAS